MVAGLGRHSATGRHSDSRTMAAGHISEHHARGRLALPLFPAARLEIAAIATDRQSMDGRGFVGVRSWTAGAAVLLFLPAISVAFHPTQVVAQTRNLMPPELMSPVPTAPGTGATLSPDSTLVPPPPPPPPPSPPQAVPMVSPGQVARAVSAR